MVRERDKLRQFGECLNEHGIKLDGLVMISFFDKLAEFYCPEGDPRAEDDVFMEAIDTMRDRLNVIEQGIAVNRNQLMLDAGLDPKNRSDSARATRWLKDSGLLTYRGPQPEQWVKRIAPTKSPEDPAPEAANTTSDNTAETDDDLIEAHLNQGKKEKEKVDA
jgi:hypothetical protein